MTLYEPFTIALNEEFDNIIKEVRGKAAEMGFSFRGNVQSGELEGKGISAKYSVSGHEVTITIHTLPIFHSSEKAERKIRKAFES